MENSIQIRNVGKCYKLYGSRRNRLKDWLLPGAGHRYTEKWVLRGIDLEVQAGEAVGIIGMNGAGKSTLLKIVTGTTAPTEGTVAFHGSVAALLELGLGFHPEFTGRQNVYMSGQLLGYTIAEINQCMVEIESFAEIGEAIDAPVRTYSSGMQVRLAFSVATMKRPDILIVDEALSVGDAYFQHKSFGRIKAFCEAGTTLLLVSHDKAAIQAVCDRAVLLDKGTILRVGEPEEIMDFYNAMIGGNGGGNIEQVCMDDGRVKTISGTREVVIQSVRMFNAKGVEAEVFAVGENCRLEVETEAQATVDTLICGMMIKDRLGQDIYGTNNYLFHQDVKRVRKGTRHKFSFFVPLNLGVGNYSITVACTGDPSHVVSNYEWIELAKVFQVVNVLEFPFGGHVYLKSRMEIETL